MIRPDSTARLETASNSGGSVSIAGRLKNIEDMLLRVLQSQERIESRLTKIEEGQQKQQNRLGDLEYSTQEVAEDIKETKRMISDM